MAAAESETGFTAPHYTPFLVEIDLHSYTAKLYQRAFSADELTEEQDTQLAGKQEKISNFCIKLFEEACLMVTERELDHQTQQVTASVEALEV